MSKTPRMDAARELDNGESCYALDLAEQLETELADMREMLREYVEAQELRDVTSGKSHVMAVVRSVQIHEKAKEVLGL